MRYYMMQVSHSKYCCNLCFREMELGLSEQRVATDGSRTTSDPKQLVTRHSTILVNLLPVTTSLIFSLLRKFGDKSCVLPRVLLYVQASSMFLTLKPSLKMQVFRVKFVTGKGCCRSKFKITCN